MQTRYLPDSSDAARVAVLDALHEHAITRPEHASADPGEILRASVLRRALAAIPDEYHAGAELRPRERFVASAIAEAKARGVSPYRTAGDALDLV